jgi:hypothetical protein
MRVTAAQTGLIAVAGRTHGVLAGLLGAGRGAVALAAITVATDQYGAAAAGAQVASSGKVHWQAGPMESRRRRPLREILCMQRRLGELGARCRNWLGGWDRCRACVSTGRSAFYAFSALSAALRLPDDNCRAIHPPVALRAANRKTGMFMPEIQKPQSPRLASLQFHLAARFLRKYETANSSEG